VEGPAQEPYTAAQFALIGLAGALVVIIIGTAAFGLGWIRVGASQGSASPPSAAASATLSPQAADGRVCLAFEKMTDAANHYAALTTMFRAMLTDPNGGGYDASAMAANVPPANQDIAAADPALTGLTYPKDPQLLVYLRTAVAAFGKGAVALTKLQKSGPNGFVGLSDIFTNLTSARDELNFANAEVARLSAAGSIPCAATY
jgi:hypothetical protein